MRAVLTCRPDVPLLDALRLRLRGPQERAVPKFSADDLRLLLERRLAVGRIFNPSEPQTDGLKIRPTSEALRALGGAVDFAAVVGRSVPLAARA